MNEIPINPEEKNYFNKKIQFKKLTGFKLMNGNDFCISFEFNTNITIKFVESYEGQIKVCGFNNKNKLISTFNNNKVQIKCLVWIKKSNSLILEGEGYSILIWQHQWNIFQKLQGHSGSISAIVINQAEDLLLSTSHDGIIKFWKNIDQHWNSQQTLDVEHSICSLSMSRLETKLITCSKQSGISVIECISNQQWSIAYDIKIDDYCKEVLFINQNSFVFQPEIIGCLKIFKNSLEKQQFIQEKRVRIKGRHDYNGGLKLQYTQEKNLLIANHDCIVKIFQINQGGEFIVQQDNGEYLILWNAGNYQIQVWKFQGQK